MPIDRAKLIDFTQRLVRIQSVNRPEEGLNEGPAADLVAEQMRSFGWAVSVEEAAPGRPNVIAVIEGSGPGRTLMFEGHTDVVTEGDPAAWSHDPFGGEIVAGRLYGRGSADMKSGVAAMLFAGAVLAEEGFPGRLVIAALVDEEEMMLGVKDFVRRGHGAGIDGAIVCEPEDGEVCIAQKGALRIRIDSAGQMAHGAMPQHGRNPIPPLAAFVEACIRIQDRLQSEHGEDALLGRPYVTPTVFLAGTPEQLNVIPAEASLFIDVRTTGADQHAEVLDLLESACAEGGLKLTVIDDRPATSTPMEHPLVVAVAAAHRAVHGVDCRYGGVPGSTDGTILVRDAGIPIVTYGPGGKWIAHQVDEYVEVEDVVRAAEVYVEAARRFLSRGIEASSSRV